MSTALDLFSTLAPRAVLDLEQRQFLGVLTVGAASPDGTFPATTAGAAVPGLAGIAIGAGSVVIRATSTVDGGGAVEISTASTPLFLDVPGGLARPATATTSGDGIWRRTVLVETTGRVALSAPADGVLLRLEAPAGKRAHLRAGAAGGGSVTLTCIPADLLLPGDVGLRLPQGVTIEPAGTTSVRVAGAILVLPAGLPLLGGLEVPFAADFGPNRGLDAEAVVDAAPVRGRLGWHDAAARHLADLVPTEGDVALDVPVSGQQAPTPAGPLTLVGPTRVSVRARIARDPTDDARGFTATVGVESPDSGGLIQVTATGSTPDRPARVVVTAFALASAVLADATPGGDQGIPQGARLAALLAAVGPLSDRFTAAGELVLHGVTVDAGTLGAGSPMRVRLDVSAAVAAAGFVLGPVKITMDRRRPLRVRWRGVQLAVATTAASFADRYAIGFADAQIDVEDPGGWQITSPGNLLEVVGTRSGHGSSWVEVDLRFALDLGPVKVSGATLRASYDGSGTLSVTLRGLDAEVNVPRLVEGGGKASLSSGGFELAARATIVPLGLGVLAVVRSAEQGDSTGTYRRTELVFGVDLPGPVPLGPTGLGLFGALGSVGINAKMPPLDGPGGVERLIGWRPWEPLEPARGQLTLGAGLVVGTSPDLAFSLSSLAYLGLTVPDLAIRAGLDAALVHGRHQLAALGQAGPPQGPELRITGALSADSQAYAMAMRAAYRIPVLLEVVVPVGASFPVRRPDWYVHIGTDGHVRRPPGPVSARVLPDLLDVGGWAFVMVHGDGIEDVAGTGRNLDGFAVAAGIGGTLVLGVPPVAWADVSAHFVAAVASDPLILIVKGGISGGLHLGPFSLGISADADLQIGPGDARYLKVRVCGEIDLWLTSISGCVEIETGARVPDLPDPPAEAWPFPTVVLADGHGQTLVEPDATAAVTASIGAAQAPQVWPDTVPLLTFPVAPVVPATMGLRSPSPPHTGTTGSDELAYTWTLDGLTLHRVDGGAETPVPLRDLATWQDSPDLPAAAVGTSAARQLALLTAHTALWTRTAADGGASRPDDRDPVKTAAGRCGITFDVRSGWALGVDAVRAPQRGHDWRLPPESRGLGAIPRVLLSSAPPVGVLVDASWPGSPGGWPVTRIPGLPGAVDPGGPVRYAELLANDPYPRMFRGALRLPHVRFSRELAPSWGEFVRGGPATAQFIFEEPVTWAVIVLLVPRAAYDSLRCHGIDDEGTKLSWDEEARELDGETLLVLLTPRDNRPWMSAEVNHVVWAPIDVLGCELTSVSAVERARAAEQAARDQAAATGRAHADVPGGKNRLVLEAGRTYRVRVTLSGTKSAPGRGIGPVAVAFPGQPPGPRSRDYFFRTAPASTTLPISVSGSLLKPIMWQRDQFSVAYLERYLMGYTPEDRTSWRFTEDPVEAHFSADHVAYLAQAYNRKVLLWLRQTDTPPGQPDLGPPREPNPLWLVLVCLFEADRRFALTASSCPLPKAGSTFRVDPAGLRPRATYDLAAAFPKSGSDPTAADLLPGVVFTTSRWASPAAALQALGFSAAPGSATGDLLVEPPAGLAGEITGDGAFADALRRLGLADLPPPTGPRTSLLWVRSGTAWAVTGLLVEADEPLHRPDAPGIDTSRRLDRMLLTRAAAGGTQLTIHRRDRSGSRLLWLASSPVTGPTTMSVTGTAQRLRGATPAAIGGSVLVPASPAFAEVLM